LVTKTSEPVRIQLAIQGGGAKIIGLVAALEAVEKLQAEGTIKVTRIAATSAGAIAGAMFAAGVHMQTLKQKLLDTDLGAFKLPSAFATVQKLLFGKPLLSQELLRKRISDLLKSTGKQNLSLKQFANNGFVPLHITATDVRNSTLRIWGPADDHDLLDAILSSAAVPFVFRTPSETEGFIADGGICENLPAVALKDYVQSDGPIVAISFAPTRSERQPPASIFKYGLALASAAIDHSVRRAKEGLAESILELDFDVDTFDFENSWKKGFDQYDHLRRQAASFFIQYAKDYSPDPLRKSIRQATRVFDASENTANQWEKDVSDMMRQVGAMYEAQHKPKKLIILKSQLLVIGHSLNPSTPGATDEVRHSVVLKAINGPIYCHRFALTHAADRTSLLHSDIEAWNSNGNSVSLFRLPMIDGGCDPAAGKSLLLSFHPVLTSENGPFTVRILDGIRAFFKPMEESGEDEVYIAAKTFEVREAEIVIHYPKDRIQLRSSGMLVRENSEEANTAGASRMTDAELRSSADTRPKGYGTFGWKCGALSLGDKLHVKLSR